MPTQPADPTARAIIVALLIVLTALGALAITLFSGERAQALTWWLQDWPRAFLFVFTLCVPLIAASFWLYRIAARTESAQRWPPPGVRLVRSSEIVTGTRVRRVAMAIKFLALLLALTSIALPTAIAWMVAELVDPA